MSELPVRSPSGQSEVASILPHLNENKTQENKVDEDLLRKMHAQVYAYRSPNNARWHRCARSAADSNEPSSAEETELAKHAADLMSALLVRSGFDSHLN